MKTSISRSRLKNAIVFFSKNTEACGKIKLFKLLYMMDFEHFKQTGKSVTGLDYEAWKFGPVPAELMREWKTLRDDLSEAIEIIREPQYDYVRETVHVRDGVEFDDEDFTPRQLKILDALCNQYLANKSQKMIDITHEQNGAWDKIWADGAGDHQTIPYELAIPEGAANRELILESARESRGAAIPPAEGGY
ncbi:SocA family protein [Duganella dendranthematis]|uniref:SocA family protein n=1 Tax=Duganella dendranthematis TaxID=2728021 RepID=A0ABX6MBZ1_9BURK|nr:Panacea domain-containing protein [Duganella dendranthematis]QJD91828.1 SocA family protein [Duganella dendranthematis]